MASVNSTTLQTLVCCSAPFWTHYPIFAEANSSLLSSHHTDGIKKLKNCVFLTGVHHRSIAISLCQPSMSANFTVKLLVIVLKGFMCGWLKIWCLAPGAKLSGNISCLYTSDEAEYVTLSLIFRTLSLLLSKKLYMWRRWLNTESA